MQDRWLDIPKNSSHKMMMTRIFVNLIFLHQIICYLSPTVLSSPISNKATNAQDADHANTTEISDHASRKRKHKRNKYLNGDTGADAKVKEAPYSPYENGILSLTYTSFLESISRDAALDDGIGSSYTLYLVAVYESDCQCSSDLIQKLENTTQLLRDHFAQLYDNDNYRLGISVSLPVVGKVDVKGAIKKDDLQLLFDIDESPQLKVVMVRHVDLKGDDDGDENDEEHDVDTEPEIYSLDFIGKESTAEEILESFIHYWYRLMVTEQSEFAAIQRIVADDPDQDGEDDVIVVDLIPPRPVFTMTSVEEMMMFLKLHASRMLSPRVRQDIWGASKREQDFIYNLMNDAMKEDPLHVFVQCRSYSDAITHTLSKQTMESYDEFEELALLYLYRKDVAFFVVVSETCTWIDDGSTEAAGGNYATNGIVRVLSIKPSHDTCLGQYEWAPTDLFNPSLRTSFQPASTNDIVVFNMADFAIVHSSPSMFWLDRHTTASIAFPTYREIHLVLFIDAHSPRRKDGSYDYDSISYLESKRIINMLHDTAKKHKKDRPSVDVVFIIVPSTDSQILSTFGMDIWSEIDRECTSRERTTVNEHGTQDECIVDGIPSLPAAMITTRKESSSYMKVYHLPSEKLTFIDDGENPLELFLGNVLDDPDSMEPTVKSESLSSNGNIVNTTLSSGIKVATGKTFQSLVLSSQKHSIVYFYAPTCGHCKRFDTTWHNLSHLITKMNWDSELDVVKVDISKNEIFLNANVDSIPAVLFFPKGRKDRPQEMILVDDLISKTGSGKNMQDRKERVENNLGGLSDVTSIVKWVMEMLGSDELKAWKRLAGYF